MSLDELNQSLKLQKFTAGWAKSVPSLWAEPRTAFRPKLWRYSDAKRGLDRAGELISADLAERRNLIMFDDADAERYASTRTIVAAYQMLKPGEHARAHRHSPSALRLVLESNKAVASVVDGIELPMETGSVLLTPSGTWHSHFNNDAANSYWIDFLDVPLVHQLEPMFFERYPDEYQSTIERPDDHPYLIHREKIETELSNAGPDIRGVRIIDISSTAMPTLQLSVMRFEDKDSAFRLHETSNSIFAVISGSGSITAGELLKPWEFGDIFTVPLWTEATIDGGVHATLLRVSDRPVMERLNLFRFAAVTTTEGAAGLGRVIRPSSSGTR